MLGVNHPETLQSVQRLAALFADNQDNEVDYLKKAKELLEECLERYTNSNTTTTTTTATATATLEIIFQLGCLSERQGQYEEARSYYKNCLEKRRFRLGEGHPDTVLVADRLLKLEANTVAGSRRCWVGSCRKQTSQSIDPLVTSCRNDYYDLQYKDRETGCVPLVFLDTIPWCDVSIRAAQEVLHVLCISNDW